MRCHGARHIKTEEHKEYQKAWNEWKRCCKIVDSHGEHFTGIHDRFLRDPVYRESQLAIGWSEQKCKEWGELAQEDHTHHLTRNSGRAVQYKLHAQFLRLFSLHDDVNDAHRAGANRLQNKQTEEKKRY